MSTTNVAHAFEDYNVRDTFSVDVHPSLTLQGRPAGNSEYIPEVDPHFVFDRAQLAKFAAWLLAGENTGAWLFGPPGSGKTSLPSQVAARLNREVIEFACNGRTEVEDLISRTRLVSGTTYPEDGPITTAYRRGAWCVLNEMDLTEPEVIAGLNDVILGRPLVLPNGEVIHPQPGFAMIVTSNTSGGGDQSGIMRGTTKQNGATRDRFTFIRCDYPQPEVEHSILAKIVPQLGVSIRQGLVKVAGHVRDLYMGNSDADSAIEVTISTRGLVRWARYANYLSQAGMTGLDALNKAAGLSFPVEDDPVAKAAIEGIIQRVFGDETQDDFIVS